MMDHTKRDANLHTICLEKHQWIDIYRKEQALKDWSDGELLTYGVSLWLINSYMGEAFLKRFYLPGVKNPNKINDGQLLSLADNLFNLVDRKGFRGFVNRMKTANTIRELRDMYAELDVAGLFASFGYETEFLDQDGKANSPDLKVYINGYEFFVEVKNINCKTRVDYVKFNRVVRSAFNNLRGYVNGIIVVRLMDPPTSYNSEGKILDQLFNRYLNKKNKDAILCLVRELTNVKTKTGHLCYSNIVVRETDALHNRLKGRDIIWQFGPRHSAPEWRHLPMEIGMGQFGLEGEHLHIDSGLSISGNTTFLK